MINALCCAIRLQRSGISYSKSENRTIVLPTKGTIVEQRTPQGSNTSVVPKGTKALFFP